MRKRKRAHTLVTFCELTSFVNKNRWLLRSLVYMMKPRGKWLLCQWTIELQVLWYQSLSILFRPAGKWLQMHGKRTYNSATKITVILLLYTNSKHFGSQHGAAFLLSNFVDPITGAHSQGIERAWRDWKQVVSDAKCLDEDHLNDYLYSWIFVHNRKVSGVHVDQIVDDMISCWS